MEVIHPRCCGIDVHKESVVACLRLYQGQRAKAEVRRFGTTTAELLRLNEWLSQAGCTHVAAQTRPLLSMATTLYSSKRPNGAG